MEEKIIHRIDKIRKHYNMSYHAFDNLFGFSNGYIGGQIRKERNVGSDVIEKIFSHFTEINPQWFLTGKGEMLSSVSEPAEKYDNNQSVDRLIDQKIETKLKTISDNQKEFIESVNIKINNFIKGQKSGK
ncbi:helix-turn-helix domain-containing protein [Abyssalbus ytuae]|uniref:Helix-turn-helix domain-containing protein n=1 Tax=Abyssalbus ytuae TaxID=2926907 RepID=A0A9E6ZZN6_9FLAO|nr:helix-turn-helix domain-containing protein [Abyssalbus ytuae]UOB16806.1 helix-turn-helix domain-containing protein [Abyssalbus ytuae]